MKSIYKTLLPLALLSVGAQAGTISSVATRAGLGANDLLAWGVAADDGNSVLSPYGRTSTGGLGVTATLTGGFTIYQEGSIFVGNFTNGEILLDSSFNDGPITIAFASAIRGVGFNIQRLDFGAFTGQIDFFGAANVFFGSVTRAGTSSGANNGSAIFLGGQSTLRDIVRIDVRVTNGVGGGNALDINQMSLLTTDPGGPVVPEPATFALVSAALAGFLFIRRRA